MTTDACDRSRRRRGSLCHDARDRIQGDVDALARLSVIDVPIETPLRADDTGGAQATAKN